MMDGAISTRRDLRLADMDRAPKEKPAEAPAAVGDRLRRIRAVSGSSQTDFARRLGLKQNTYSSYENGSRKCSVEAAILVCRSYDATLDYIFMARTDGLAQVRINELKNAR